MVALMPRFFAVGMYVAKEARMSHSVSVYSTSGVLLKPALFCFVFFSRRFLLFQAHILIT